MKKNIGFLFVFFLTFSLFSFAQKEHELDSTVPELSEFHEIIYPIWHTAYPEKDYASLRSFLPQVNESAEKIFAAELPGILRDKKSVWEKGVAELKASVNEFNSAVKGTDDDVLLKSAEKLHAKYENLVRIVRPVLKEVDEFHKDMYTIYHYYLPEKQYDKIKALGNGLVAKTDAITKAKLSKRLESKHETFDAAASALFNSAKVLNELLQKNAFEDVDAAVEKMHTKYQNLEEIF